MIIVPHAPFVFESIRPTIKRPLEMAMNLVMPLPALVNERELEKRPDLGAFASQRDEDRHVSRVILGVLAVRVEEDPPLVASDGEVIARDVLPHAHPFRQSVPLYHELVRAVHRLRHRFGARRG